jgi:hypothetical protein
MDRIWIVTANAARARVFERDPRTAAIEETLSLAHPASRRRGAELETDRPGQVQRGYSATSRGSTQLEPPLSPHERERAKFAHELAGYLEAEVLAHRCPGWLLFASDPFFGDLKGQLGDAARHVLLGAEPHDLTAADRHDLERRATAMLEAVG